jgi:hypothetical protein
MLVMAIEATKQLAHGSRTIKGYRIKDVFFESSLNSTSSSDGVETQISLRANEGSTQISEKWSEFRVCTFVDGEWVKNCYGSIQAEYEEEETEMNSGRSVDIDSLQFTNAYILALKSFKPVDAGYLYQRMAECGFNYGPAFRPLHSVAINGDGEAIAEIRQFEWLPATHFQPHVIHPTTFDGVLQLIATALTNGGREETPTIVPTYIHNMWISDSGLSPPTPSTPITSVRAHVKSTLEGYRGSRSSLFVLDDTDHLRMTMEGVETTIVGDISTSRPQETQRCYSIDWKPDLDLLDPIQILEYCRPGDIDLRDTKLFYEDLTLALFFFVSTVKNTISANEPDHTPSHIARYIQWLKKQLDDFDAGILPDRNLAWTTTMANNKKQAEEACHRLEDTRQGKLFVRVGENLSKILQGEIDPLRLLFEGDLVKDYHHDIFDSVYCMSGLGKYLDTLAHHNPAMRILEVVSALFSIT